MFSTTQKEFYEPFIEQQYKNGYKYFLVHTNTNLTSTSTYNFEDLTIYVSKNEIKQTSLNQFSTNGEVLKYGIITRNVSNNNTDTKEARINKSSHNGSIEVMDYEFINTNASESTHLNSMALEEIQYNNNLAFNIDINDYFLIPLVLCITLLFHWLNTWFSKNRGSNL